MNKFSDLLITQAKIQIKRSNFKVKQKLKWKTLILILRKNKIK